VPAGQWSFPFELDLPNWCPSSVFYAGIKESELQIKYKIKAFISATHGKMTVEGMRRVIVRRPPFEMALGQTLDSTQNITTCCCLAKGKTSLNVNFEANAYTPYEVAKCFVEVNNRECSIPIESVTFKLKRKVWAQAKTGQTLNIPDATMTTATFPGAAAFQDSKREHWSLDLNKAREANPLQMLRQRPDKKVYPEEDFALQREPL
jgi:hypothetical protein